MSKRKFSVKALVVLAGFFLLSATTALSQDYCEGDFDYDGDQDGLDAATFKQDFGRSQYNNPCPPDDRPAPLPKTGQTTSYATDDDGDLEKGVVWPNPRFTDNLDGTVTDNLTGLIWLKNANCSTFGTFGDPESWYDALSDCNGLASGSCGLSDSSSAGDWILPNLRELQSLIDYGEYGPALPSGHPFDDVQSGFSYWSSTTNAFDTGCAYGVLMSTGRVNYYPKLDFLLRVACARR